MRAIVKFDGDSIANIERGDVTITVIKPGKLKLFGLLGRGPERTTVYRGRSNVYHDVATGDRAEMDLESWLGDRFWKAQYDALEQLKLKDRGDAAHEVPQNTSFALEPWGN